MTATEATTSVQHRREHMRRISMIDSLKGMYVSVTGSYLSRTSSSITIYVITEKKVKDSRVLKKPNIRMLLKF